MVVGVLGLGEERHKPGVEKIGWTAIRDSLVGPQVGWMGSEIAEPGFRNDLKKLAMFL